MRGSYAPPLRWRDSVIGWANLARRDGRLLAELGFVTGTPPTDPAFATALYAELERVRRFLGIV